jgi:hypothetical protein
MLGQVAGAVELLQASKSLRKARESAFTVWVATCRRKEQRFGSARLFIDADIARGERTECLFSLTKRDKTFAPLARLDKPSYALGLLPRSHVSRQRHCDS